jgi:2-phospho-L-lactate/phosphoenolpyruvate guanylyltransferase
VVSSAVVVPVKAFGEAKVRLAGALDPGERARLARHMAEIVLLAAAPLPVVVVCDDEGVRVWAESSGARAVWCPGRGLNGAVADGVAALAAAGVERAVVAHADLPLATRLGLRARLVQDPRLAWDVDLPADLAWPGAGEGGDGDPLAGLAVGSPRSS